MEIFNESLEQSYVPSGWKHSEVIPIQKVNNTKKAEEFRPINVLPQYEKVLEKIVSKQVINYFEKNEIFIHEQFGFREEMSCEKAVQNIVSSWRRSIDNGNIVGAILT